MPYATSLPIAMQVRQIVNTMETAIAFIGLQTLVTKLLWCVHYTYMSQPRRTWDIQGLNGRPSSRANDLGHTSQLSSSERDGKERGILTYQSCLEVVVTPLIEQVTTSIRITTVITFAAARECVAFRTTAIYGWPVGDSNTDSTLPMQNISVTTNKK